MRQLNLEKRAKEIFVTELASKHKKEQVAAALHNIPPSFVFALHVHAGSLDDLNLPTVFCSASIDN